MSIVILVMIAFWFLDLPLALQILMTIFGSLHCIFRIIGICVKAYQKQNEPKKTGNELLDRFIK